MGICMDKAGDQQLHHTGLNCHLHQQPSFLDGQLLGSTARIPIPWRDQEDQLVRVPAILRHAKVLP